MLGSGGPMLALFQQAQIRLKKQLIENQPQDNEQNDLIDDAVIKMNHGSTTANNYAFTLISPDLEKAKCSTQIIKNPHSLANVGSRIGKVTDSEPKSKFLKSIYSLGTEAAADLSAL